MAASGSCQCGEVHYTVDGDALMTYVCHCKDCQKRTGSAFSMGAIYPVSAITVTGDLSTWERTSDEGSTNTRYSCKHCGNIIYGIGSSSPDFIKLQPGTLDDTSHINADAHIWTRSAQAWLVFPENALKYETQPGQLIEIFQAVMERKADARD
jgi:hypothetical protein